MDPFDSFHIARQPLPDQEAQHEQEDPDTHFSDNHWSTVTASPPNINPATSFRKRKADWEHEGKKPKLNPEAPTFVPHQSAVQKTLPDRHAPIPQPGQVPQSDLPIQVPRTATPLDQSSAKVPLYGSTHGLDYNRSTNLFTGDGPARRSPYRLTGTLPAQPNLIMEAFDEEMMRALRSFEKEDALHLQGHRAVRTGMAGFGSRTPVSQHRLGIPSPRQQQYGDRVRGLGDVGGGVGGAGEGDFEGVTVRDYAYPEWQ